MHYRFASTFNNFFKALIKYINMQQDWPLRSLIIYQKLEPIINSNLMSVSVGLNSGILQTLTTKDCKGPQTNMPKNVGSINT